MKTKAVLFVSFILLQFLAHSQIMNTIDKVKLNLPCKLIMIYNQNSVKSFSCATMKNNIPFSYRVTFEDFTNTIQKQSQQGYDGFIEDYLNKIKKNNITKNVKSRTFHQLRAIQFDDFYDIDPKVQVRTFVFVYQGKSISFNFSSIPSGFDSRFEVFLKNISLIQ